MSDDRLDIEPGLARLNAETWLQRLDEIGEEHGYLQRLGDAHVALFLDAGSNLLVTFEQMDSARRAQDGMPTGMSYAIHDGWSHLAILSEGESWFRDPAIYGFFDRLIDDGFFEDFDRVLFHGTHAGGYAAAAYSVAAPGARVLAFRPQATLDPGIAGWDTRYASHRRADFTSRYGYAPDMIDAADHAWIVFDPLQRFDAIHAALFTRGNVTALPARGMGVHLDISLGQLGIRDTLVREAMDGTLTRRKFAALYRERRDHVGYLKVLHRTAIQRDHPQLAAEICAFVLRRGPDGYFEGKLAELADQGIKPRRPLRTDAA